MGTQQRLDAPPQLRVRRALAVEDGGAARRVRGLDRGEEDGLNTFLIDGDGTTLRRIPAL
jgi:hypothetical protein